MNNLIIPRFKLHFAIALVSISFLFSPYLGFSQDVPTRIFIDFASSKMSMVYIPSPEYVVTHHFSKLKVINIQTKDTIATSGFIYDTAYMEFTKSGHLSRFENDSRVNEIFYNSDQEIDSILQTSKLNHELLRLYKRVKTDSGWFYKFHHANDHIANIWTDINGLELKRVEVNRNWKVICYTNPKLFSYDREYFKEGVKANSFKAKWLMKNNQPYQFIGYQKQFIRGPERFDNCLDTLVVDQSGKIIMVDTKLQIYCQTFNDCQQKHSGLNIPFGYQNLPNSNWIDEQKLSLQTFEPLREPRFRKTVCILE